MPSASEATQHVTSLHPNWVPDADGGDGQFQLLR